MFSPSNLHETLEVATLIGPFTDEADEAHPGSMAYSSQASQARGSSGIQTQTDPLGPALLHADGTQL